MIVLVFWGSRRTSQDLGGVAAARCPNCERRVVFHRAVMESTSHIFFIPVSTDTTEELVCPACGLRIRVHGDVAIAAGTMSADTTRWQAGMMTDENYLAGAMKFWHTVSASEDYHGPPIDATSALVPLDAEVQADAGWFADPTGRHDHRFFDGDTWTAYVLDGETTSNDTFLTPSSPGWYPDPQRSHELRRWDGRAWTEETRDVGDASVTSP